MFAVGNVWIGQYKVWITVPVFTNEPWNNADQLPYYEVMVTHIIDKHYYLNPVKDILRLDLTDRNPLGKTKDKDNPTLEEKEFWVEHQSYLSRKDQPMPLWKLSKRHVEKLLATLSRDNDI